MAISIRMLLSRLKEKLMKRLRKRTKEPKP
jgi:hypothetical protein